MTSRRVMPTYEARVSRAFQFKPGHMLGRVASAQPIRRRGGTVRRFSLGEAETEPTPGEMIVDLIPINAYLYTFAGLEQATATINLYGGSVTEILGDASDSTYVSAVMMTPAEPDDRAPGRIRLDLPAWTPPLGKVITDVRAQFRTRLSPSANMPTSGYGNGFMVEEIGLPPITIRRFQYYYAAYPDIDPMDLQSFYVDYSGYAGWGPVLAGGGLPAQTYETWADALARGKMAFGIQTSNWVEPPELTTYIWGWETSQMRMRIWLNDAP